MSIDVRLSSRSSHARNFYTVLEKRYGAEKLFLEVSRRGESSPELTVLVLTENTLDLATFNELPPADNMNSPIDLHIESYPLSRISCIKESYFTPRLHEGVAESSSINFLLKLDSAEPIEFSLLRAHTYSDEIYPDYFRFLNELKGRLN